MRIAALLAGALLLALASSASATPEPARPGDGRVAPEPDITPAKLMGANARARNGPDPMAAPPDDVGGTPDPDETPPLPPKH